MNEKTYEQKAFQSKMTLAVGTSLVAVMMVTLLVRVFADMAMAGSAKASLLQKRAEVQMRLQKAKLVAHSNIEPVSLEDAEIPSRHF